MDSGGKVCGVKPTRANPGGGTQNVERGTKRRMQCKGDNTEQGVLVGLKELPSQADKRGNGCIEHGMKLRSATLD